MAVRTSTRREFVLEAVTGSSLACSFLAAGEKLLLSQSPTAARYDLLIKGGHVIDPAQGLSGALDVAIVDRIIAGLAPNLPVEAARHVLKAHGMVVTPGLIDIHVHVYHGVTPHGIPADPNCIA